MPNWLREFCVWLAQTSVSQTLQTVEWVVPTVQTIHILAISALISSVFIIALRLIGVVGNDRPLARVSERCLPVIWWTLPILLTTGCTLIVIEPLRSLGSAAFQLKMALLLAAALLTWCFQRAIVSDSARWEPGGRTRQIGRLVAALSLVLWVGVLFAGRWIAYSSGK